MLVLLRSETCCHLILDSDPSFTAKEVHKAFLVYERATRSEIATEDPAIKVTQIVHMVGAHRRREGAVPSELPHGELNAAHSGACTSSASSTQWLGVESG